MFICNCVQVIANNNEVIGEAHGSFGDGDFVWMDAAGDIIRDVEAQRCLTQLLQLGRCEYASFQDREFHDVHVLVVP